MFQWYQRVTLGILFCLLLVTMPVYAVEVFKVSEFDGGHQIWFEAEAFDAREPDSDQFFPIAGEEANTPKPPNGVFGKAITRSGGAGGRLVYTFDISKAGGTAGDWYFWGRVVNPSNQSDYLLVKGDPEDKKIPDTAPFPGGNETKPFVNADDRIFEADVAKWGWDGGAREGHQKELQDGENTMYIYHRQGNSTRFMDVFMWADNSNYRPVDDDYNNATEMKAGQAVEFVDKLATVWGQIKTIH